MIIEHVKSILKPHDSWIRSIAVHPSGKFFVTACSNVIYFFDFDYKVIDVFTGHTANIRTLYFSKVHPHHLYSAGEDRSICCWDLSQRKCIRRHTGHHSDILCMKHHPALDIFITGSRDNSLRLWDPRTSYSFYELKGHSDAVTCLETMVSDPQIISGSEDSTIRTWDLRSLSKFDGGKCLSILTHHRGTITSLLGHKSIDKGVISRTLISAAADCVRKWSISGNHCHDEGPLFKPVDIQPIMKDSKSGFSLTDVSHVPTELRLLYPHAKQCVTDSESIVSHGLGEVNAMLYLDSDSLLTCHQNGSLHISDVSSGRTLGLFEPPTEKTIFKESRCSILSMVHFKDIILTGHMDNTVKIHKVDLV
ncbi:hypothetical protein ADUPG1_005933 [Aduncisulcus paluster]|uniref:Uncharacterized protein n=1 Tax=Aduncisulcus paluster TaxID=2918883 RepID=A0ABQ5KGA1_9EUKA|nr:hypothetical protein ADUPG1_005933 [Aduncisulcus paluster]